MGKKKGKSKGAGPKKGKTPRILHYRNTEIAVMHCLSMLGTFGPRTKADMRDPLAEDLHRRGLSWENAYDVATMRIDRALQRLKKPQVYCVGLDFPYVLTSKNLSGNTIYTSFPQWTTDDIEHYADILKENRIEVRTAETRKAAQYQILLDEMERCGAREAGQLEFSWTFPGDDDE